jgi:protein-S-isoprenylcysteine O-methyltransferase Ste14
MDTARRILGILLVIGMPPAIAFWLVVHPFVRWWRRVDVRLTYTVLAVFMIALALGLFAVRTPLLGRDLGTNWWLVGIGGVLYLMSAAVSLRCRRQLSLKIFAGVPEVSPAAFPGQLLQEGVYGVVRHPRYLSVVFGTIGMALIVNYLGAFIVVLISVISLWPLIVLEERELANRFGSAYAAYRSRVPALIPRFWRR